MRRTIDVAMNVSGFADQLHHAGVRTVIRYYNHRNSSVLPTKRLDPPEAEVLADAGLNLMTVFQQRGGAGGHIEDLDAESGSADATRALELAAALGQPEGSAIYFAVDHDFYKQSELNSIRPYFERVREVLGNRYRVGCYGSGTVGGTMQRAGLVDLIWLAGATGWSGTKDMLQTDAWALFQKDLHKTWPGGGFSYDGNVLNPAFPDHGQFVLGSTPASDRDSAPLQATTIMEVTARSGLRVRRGPSTAYEHFTVLPTGSLVHAVSRVGDWVKVDLEGDGQPDGFMHGDYLRILSGGFPLADSSGTRPIDIARAELALDIREVPGGSHNPRIVMYHATTKDGAAADEVAWCSSFMNYCVEQAGMVGTDSKWAMSWHDSRWGLEVTGTPRDGDIVVWRRREQSASGAIKGGHVAFWVGDAGDGVTILGGNQSNRVKISTYPKKGVMPDTNTFYEILSLRRP